MQIFVRISDVGIGDFQSDLDTRLRGLVVSHHDDGALVDCGEVNANIVKVLRAIQGSPHYVGLK